MKVRNPINKLVVNKKTYWLHTISILAIVLFIGMFNYYNQAQAAQEIADKHTAQLIACLNGKAFWKAEDGTEVGCMKAETQ